MSKKLKKGNRVVMHSCMEAKGKNWGRIWECDCDEFDRNTDNGPVVFLKGFSGSFHCEFLQKINDENIPKKTPTVVCLCGSTRFYGAFQMANFEETIKGNIVLSVGFYPHSQKKAHGTQIDFTNELKKALDDLHKRKIDLADEIYVLDIDGYIGASTKSEIEYAKQTNKIIRYWSKEQ